MTTPAKLILGFLLSLVVVAGCGDNRDPDVLRLDRSTAELAVGATVTVTARSSGMVPTELSWASSNPTVATVTPGSNGTAALTGVAAGTATITATSNDQTASVVVTVTDAAATLTSIAITPPAPSLAAGTSTQLTATGMYSDGSTADLTATATWTSATIATATVDAAGLLRGLVAGTSVITATVGTISGTTTATVTAATLIGIDVTPTDPTLARGTTQQLTATGRFSNATTQNLTSQVVWSSATATVATVSAGGLVTAVAVGNAVVSATMGTITGNVTVTVTGATLTSIDVTPATASIADGVTQQFTATGRFSDTTTQNLTTMVVWSSGTATVATIATTGLATALDPGTTTITATSGAITGTATLTVTAATLVSLQITPVNPTVVVGGTQQFTATGTFSDTTTQNLTGTVTWTAGTIATATISNAAGSRGVATAVGAGTSLVTATLGAITATTTLTVTAATLVSIAVTPANPSVVVGSTQAFVATGTYSDTTSAIITDAVTWTSATVATATISNAAGSRGVATAVAAGTSLVTATLGAVSGSTTLTATAATLLSIAVTPANPSVAVAGTQAFVATGTYSDTTSAIITDLVTWTSGTVATATISNAAGSRGVATAVAAGTTTITATLGAVTDSTTLTVTAAVLMSIAVTPANPSLAAGATQLFVATGTYSDASTAVLTTTVTWASDDVAVAQISGAVGSEGLATAVAVGTATISATLGAVTGSTTLTVTAPATLVSIAVTPAAPSVNIGATVQLTATGTYSDAMTADLTATATWSSATPATATVSAAGLVTGVAAGTVEITATSGAVVGAAVVTVVIPPPTVVAVFPLDGSTGARAATPIVVTFSTAMDVATLTAQTVTGACTGSLQLSADGFTTCVGFTAAAPTMSAVNTVASLQPAAVLGTLRHYQVRIAASVSSLATLPLGSIVTQATGFRVATDGSCGASLMISQLYGAGGNNAAALNADFVELHNPGRTPVSLGGMSLQYASASGTAWAPTPLPNVMVPAGGYFTVRMTTPSTTNGIAFTADFQANPTRDLSGSNGKIALVAGIAPLPVATCPLSSTVDLVGYGSANCSEGTALPVLSGTTGGLRAGAGCTDANVNSTDFSVVTVTPTSPRTAATAPLSCACTANETDRVAEVDFCNLQFPATLSVAAGAMSPLVYARAFETGVTESAGANPDLFVDIGFGAAGVNPATAPGFTWIAAAFNVQVSNDDEYQGAFTAPAAGTYGYTSRVSRDGSNWTYCDLDGAGANTGLGFDVAQLGVLTVTP